MRGAAELIVGIRPMQNTSATSNSKMMSNSKDDLHNVPYEMQPKNKSFIGSSSGGINSSSSLGMAGGYSLQ